MDKIAELNDIHRSEPWGIMREFSWAETAEGIAYWGVVHTILKVVGSGAIPVENVKKFVQANRKLLNQKLKRQKNDAIK